MTQSADGPQAMDYFDRIQNRLGGAGEQDRPDLRVGVQLLHRRDDGTHRRLVQRIQGLRPV
ncbi:hypothetical protein, partial [Micrococcus sp. F3Y]|uniref:hypothetical protein n=1 Tax=Micrococcus sp. F3Y TaxID=3402627 RepID=UPI003AF89667